MMKVSSLREQTNEELRDLLMETRRQGLDLKVKGVLGDAAEQPLKKRTLRREIARIETILRERELKNHG